MTYLHTLAEGIARPPRVPRDPPARSTPEPVDETPQRPDRSGGGPAPPPDVDTGKEPSHEPAPPARATEGDADLATHERPPAMAARDDEAPSVPTEGSHRGGDAAGSEDAAEASPPSPSAPRDPARRERGSGHRRRTPRAPIGAGEPSAAGERAEPHDGEGPPRPQRGGREAPSDAPIAEQPTDGTGDPTDGVTTTHDRVAALLADLAARATDDDGASHAAGDAPQEQRPPPEGSSAPTPPTEPGREVRAGPVLHIGTIDVVVEAPPARAATGTEGPAPASATSLMARLHLGRA